jgi:hypothetical protein
MSYEDQTQRLRVAPATPDLDTPTETTTPEDTTPADTTTTLPGPLDLAGPTPPPPAATSDTGVLSLDDMFEPPTQASAPSSNEPPAARPDAAAEAPTWTAMPVVSVRSEPTSPPAAPHAPPTAQSRRHSELGQRVRSDAAAAWTGARTRTQDWLGRDDHALMIMTALVAIVLIIVVAALGG